MITLIAFKHARGVCWKSFFYTKFVFFNKLVRFWWENIFKVNIICTGSRYMKVVAEASFTVHHLCLYCSGLGKPVTMSGHVTVALRRLVLSINPLGLLSKSCRKLSPASTQCIYIRQRRMSSSSPLSFDQHTKLKENKKLTVWWIENQAEFEIGLIMLFISMWNYRLFVIWNFHFWSQ